MRRGIVIRIEAFSALPDTSTAGKVTRVVIWTLALGFSLIF